MTTLTTAQTIGAVSTTVSQQITRSTTVHHHTSSVPSVEPTTIVDNVTQQSQGMLIDKLHRLLRMPKEVSYHLCYNISHKDDKLANMLLTKPWQHICM